MSIYKDRFKPGDVVTWRNEEYATMTGGRSRLGERLTIKKIRDVINNFHEVNHMQHVTLVEDPNAGFDLNSSCFSGVYFRHLLPKERDLDLTSISKSYPYLSLARQLGLSYSDVLLLSDFYAPKYTTATIESITPIRNRINSVSKHLICQLTCAVEAGEIGHGE
jgi:hypothetical protein